jgi:hypothetical protein
MGVGGKKDIAKPWGFVAAHPLSRRRREPVERRINRIARRFEIIIYLIEEIVMSNSRLYNTRPGGSSGNTVCVKESQPK